MPSGIYKRSTAQKKHLRKICAMMNKLPRTKIQIERCRAMGKTYGRLHSHLFEKGLSHFKWSGGKHTRRGYVFIYSPEHPFSNKGYALEHRLVIEKILNRFLFPEEEVHHENKIRNDNRPENLIAFSSRSAHIRWHKNPSTVKPEEIVFFGPKPNKRKRRSIT